MRMRFVTDLVYNTPHVVVVVCVVKVWTNGLQTCLSSEWTTEARATDCLPLTVTPL